MNTFPPINQIGAQHLRDIACHVKHVENNVTGMDILPPFCFHYKNLATNNFQPVTLVISELRIYGTHYRHYIWSHNKCDIKFKNGNFIA